MGFGEIVLLALAILLVWAMGNYGKATRLGFFGSVVLAILTTPIIAFFILSILKGLEKKKNSADLHLS